MRELNFEYWFPLDIGWIMWREVLGKECSGSGTCASH